jgi:hypothetical protein
MRAGREGWQVFPVGMAEFKLMDAVRNLCSAGETQRHVGSEGNSVHVAQLKGWTEAINSRAFALHNNEASCRLDSSI